MTLFIVGALVGSLAYYLGHYVGGRSVLKDLETVLGGDK